MAESLPGDIATVGGIEIQNLVKAGKLSQEAALAYAEKCGLIPTKDVNMERLMSVSKTKEVFNFSVYKWNRVRTVQRLILQFDFKSHVLSDIQQGRRAEKIDFKDILSYQSEDGLRLLIQFANHGEYELDANTLDEKNKMIRLLGSILHHYQNGHAEIRDDQVPLLAETAEEETGSVQSDSAPVSEPVTPLMDTQPSPIIPRTIAPSVLKEGLVEKRGHSAAFLMWPKRYLKVCEGELLYYKPEDREQALNIIPLKPNVTKVKKNDSNTFTVSLVSSKKSFSFRTLGNEQGKTAQQERDEWYEVIQAGCHSRRMSDARLRSGTITAKQQMEEMKMKRRSRLQQQKPRTISEEDPFENLESSDELSAQLEKKSKRDRPRSQTITIPQQSFKQRFKKHASMDSSSSDPQKRRSATFYVPPVTQDVTSPYTRAVEMEELRIWDKSQSELLDLLKRELEVLASVVLPSTTGTAQIDMIVVRMGSIISALQLHDTRSLKSVESECDNDSGDKRNSVSPVSATSLPAERVVDGSSDVASTMSSDNVEKMEDLLSPSPALTSPSAPAARPPSANSDNWSTEVMPDRNEESVSPFPASVPPPTKSMDEEAVSSCPDQEAACSLPPVSEKTEAPLPPNPGITLSPASPVPGVLGAPPPPPPPMPGAPGVPPPPPFAMISLPALPGRQPKKKMKRFHWTPLPPIVVKSSGWMSWAQKDVTEELDYSQLDKLFAAEGEEKKKPNIRKKVVASLLDHTRSRNIEIFLPSFPLPVQLLDTDLDHQLNIIEGDTKLSIEHIVALKRFQPTHEEKEMYKNYPHDKTQLPIADTFLLKLCEVPMLSMRLDLLFTIREFPSNMEEFQPTLDLAWSACRELDQSEEFVEVLQYVLAIGNYLNAGTTKGNAYGFKLGYLPKLVDFKGQEKTTLLEFLVKQLHSKKSELLSIPSSLESVAKASEISITSILAELEVMGNELDKIEKNGIEIAKHPKISEQAGMQLRRKVKVFVGKYRDKLAELDAKGQEMSTTYTKLLLKFGEPASMDSEDFFSTIAKFLIQFKKVCTERFPQTPKSRPSRHAAKDAHVAQEPTPTSPEQNPTPQKTPTLQKTTPQKTPTLQKTTSQRAPKMMKSLTIDVTVVPQNGKQKVSGPDATNAMLVPQRQGFRRMSRKVEPKEDYLEKKTSEGRWAKRYFELEQGKLHYYGSKGHDYRQTINMRGVPVRLLKNDPRVIEIESENRVYQLKAKNTDVASDWLKALQNHSLL